MRITGKVLVLSALSIVNMLGCSNARLQEIGYATLQNLQEQQCRKDPTLDCSQRLTYAAYQQRYNAAHPVPPEGTGTQTNRR